MDLPERWRHLGGELSWLVGEVLRWGRVHNLTAHGDEEGVWCDLVWDSLVVAEEVVGGELLDIGTGAGFPGLVVALARPELEVVLLESRGKRVSFLRHAVRGLGLGSRVGVVWGRASRDRAGDPEEIAGRRFGTVTMRAVGGLGESLGLGCGYVAEGGRLVLPRGLGDLDQARALGLRAVEYELPGRWGRRFLAVWEG